ncbi:GPN-loop GTPase QQT2 [Selaginella moellendorffii]|uniref:GPN-loop GTPase QQT2 n=1 Tax=Selaginella moellendorffii TaxID=88036 RepID=UPI000D1C567A|nr:GPN-loop GTPase QQT2 [Selaginella moellendorffii]|eukprot:XP_024516946.1 GPN-loop GTPase QQT2 [Selaginella moellendorffii]
MEVFDKRPVVLIIIRMVLSHQVENFLLCSPPLRRQWEDAADASPRLEIHAMKQWPRVLQQTEWTSLNLFATKIDEIVEKRDNEVDYVLIYTPGQIEIFTWSASGAIVTEAFACTFPSSVICVVDIFGQPSYIHEKHALRL